MICVKILALLLLVWLVCVIMLVSLMIVMISRVSSRYPRRRPNPIIDDTDDDDDGAASEAEHRRKIRSIDAVLSAKLPHDPDVESSLPQLDHSADYYKLHYTSDSEGYSYS